MTYTLQTFTGAYRSELTNKSLMTFKHSVSVSVLVKNTKHKKVAFIGFLK